MLPEIAMKNEGTPPGWIIHQSMGVEQEAKKDFSGSLETVHAPKRDKDTDTVTDTDCAED